MYSACHFRTILLSYGFWLLSYEYWIFGHISVNLKQLQRMRRITWPLTGGENSPHFLNPWRKFTYSLSHFQGATTNTKPCYRRKIAFSDYRGYKVSCACVVTLDLPRKTVQSKPVTKVAVSRKLNGLISKYSYRDPQGVLAFRDRRHLTILRKNPFSGVGYSLIEVPKRRTQN